MLGAGRGIDVLNRLGVRLAVLLSLALLPLGAIALFQTYRALEEGRQRAEVALMGRTVQAAAFEKELIQTAIGAGRAFGVAIEPVLNDRTACGRLFQRFIEASGLYVFGGFIDAGGAMRCTSAGVSLQFADSPVFQDMRANPRVLTSLSRYGPVSGGAVIIVTVPVMDGDRFRGAVSIFLPHGALLNRVRTAGEIRPIDLVSFNAAGEVLTSAAGLDGVEQRLPRDLSLRTLASGPAVSFTAVTGEGQERVFSVVPIIEDTVFAISSWTTADAVGPLGGIPFPSVGIPILMWLASLWVAYFAVHRLVIRHIRDLLHQIRVFSSTRRTVQPRHRGDLPAELSEVSDAFQAMTDRIIADEADLENSLVEKNVLLKEVHHRVKNNLQLITSMISMQLRKARDDDTRHILRRLQDRVMGLAVIHENLYHASSLSKVRADVLVHEIVNQLLLRALGPGSGIDVTHKLAPTTLYPDQAVPLALLANEAITNSLKYLGAPSTGRPWIDVQLTAMDGNRVALRVENSAGPPVGATIRKSAGSGLGTQLIQAFVVQLNGTLDSGEADGVYWLRVVFRVAEFEAASEPDPAALPPSEVSAIQ